MSDPEEIIISDLIMSTDAMWLMFATALIFFMQAGFALLESGSVRLKNAQNILVKNIMDACVGAVFFFLLGYGLAFGDKSSSGGFIGQSHFAGKFEDDFDYVKFSF
jgi:Amt family ammonium transporter